VQHSAACTPATDPRHSSSEPLQASVRWEVGVGARRSRHRQAGWGPTSSTLAPSGVMVQVQHSQDSCEVLAV
jgi:hypothetical protein